MEKILVNMHVFMLSCIKHACFHVFSPFSAYFFAHDIIVEKGPLQLYFNLAVVGLALVSDVNDIIQDTSQNYGIYQTHSYSRLVKLLVKLLTD